MVRLKSVKGSVERVLQSPSIRGGLFYAALWGVFGSFFPFMYLELSRRGFSGLQIGTIGSIRAAVILVMAMVFSRIADQKNIRVKMLRWVLMIAAVAVVIFSFPKTFPFLVGSIIFLAIWQSPIDSLGNSILVRMSTKYNVDYGMMTFWGAVAFAVMNLIGGFVWEKIGFSWMYLVGGIGYLAVSFVVTTLEEPEKEATNTTLESAQEEIARKKPLKPVVIVFLAGYFIFSLAFVNAFGFTANILDMRGASEFVIGLVGTLVGVGGMFVRRSHRKLITSLPLSTVMIIGICLGIVPIIVYGWVQNVTILLLVGMLRGASWGMFSLCGIHFIDQQASVENASTLQSSLIMLNTFANIIASTLSGYLFDTNPTLIFIISGIAAFIALGILFVVQRICQLEDMESLAQTSSRA